jgi:hypothetical protein
MEAEDQGNTDVLLKSTKISIRPPGRQLYGNAIALASETPRNDRDGIMLPIPLDSAASSLEARRAESWLSALIIRKKKVSQRLTMHLQIRRPRRTRHRQPRTPPLASNPQP